MRIVVIFALASVVLAMAACASMVAKTEPAPAHLSNLRALTTRELRDRIDGHFVFVAGQRGATRLGEIYCNGRQTTSETRAPINRLYTIENDAICITSETDSQPVCERYYSNSRGALFRTPQNETSPVEIQTERVQC
ncbi:hypothetical protein [Terricaulis sp.]|uniref:hypothetical protein n=1 Tax=Terricaulis sp. TaxID=2768686 RepID=UPI003784DC10